MEIACGRRELAAPTLGQFGIRQRRTAKWCRFWAATSCRSRLTLAVLHCLGTATLIGWQRWNSPAEMPGQSSRSVRRRSVRSVRGMAVVRGMRLVVGQHGPAVIALHEHLVLLIATNISEHKAARTLRRCRCRGQICGLLHLRWGACVCRTANQRSCGCRHGNQECCFGHSVGSEKF